MTIRPFKDEDDLKRYLRELRQYGVEQGIILVDDDPDFTDALAAQLQGAPPQEVVKLVK